ncbi:hypothetical protein CPAV1605_889 [seawater metagenome]|uniref:Helicase conserved C-terminal domain n=1 Tax=seawater metagenome TaxID=1561972 RepID=A0A5E8CKF1_9ZZZZ
MNFSFTRKFDELITELENKKYKFVDKIFQNTIKNIINQIFIVLNAQDKKFLFILTKDLIEEIAIRNNFDPTSDYYNQFYQNNFQDIKAIINLTLPYIDDANNYKNHKNLNFLNDLLQPKSTFNSDKIKTLTNNEFKFCNIAYDLLRYQENIWVPYEDIYNVLVNNYYALLHTLEVISGKLYVNWINIRPLSIDSFKNSKLYRKTLESYNDLKINPTLEQMKKYRGLYLGDIYNTIVQDFYLKIKKAKWLIYVSSSNGKLLLNISILNKIIPLQNILEKNNWDDLDFQERELLYRKWEKFKYIIQNKDDYGDYSNAIIAPLFKYLIVFFRTQYSKKQLLYELNPEFKKVLELQDDDDDENEKDLKKINDLSEIQLLDIIKDIDFQYIYDFLYESISNLEKTFYGKKIITYQNNIPTISNNPYVLNTDTNQEYNYPLMMKNLYNYGKSIYHNNYNENSDSKIFDWDTKFEFYQSMSKKCKIFFINKLFLKQPYQNWFSLQNNYKYVYPNDNNYSQYIKEIINQISSNILDLVFQNLIYKGILSEFHLDRPLTDENLMPTNYHEKNKYIKNKLKQRIFTPDNIKEFDNAYYFINQKKYKDITDLKIEKNKNYVKTNFYEFVCETKPYWFRFYAMDWICQIQFYHHYIHNRVMLVTGSTGQGKSTQVPKLLMYSLIMLDYKNDGKVVCTQPRIPPTVENAENISKQMAIPIKEYSNVYKENIRTGNYAIQFKHSQENHISKQYDSTYLRIVTDGTLFEEIVTNPLLKEKQFGQNINSFKYSDTNKYDIVIVDEAHEHNVNMDFILTVSKNSLYLNNSIRLIIISATIDEDEPIYRRYYREINDNILYPLNLGSDYTPNLNLNLVVEKKFVDRRYHISPPGKTTQHVIQDIYLKNIEFTNDDSKDSEIAQDESIQQALRVTRSDPNGEILLFSIGVGEIKAIVTKLNILLPPGNVALPYYGTMNMKYKFIIQKIDKEIVNIRNKREDIANEWGTTFISNKSVPTGIYKRAIIVATNVAEASITIPRLKYVIDNGFAKVSKYDIHTKTDSLVIEKISEASRMQRRGRVGRLADGIVYYMYPKGAREQVLPKYNITNQNISLQLYKLLQANTYFNKEGNYEKSKNELLILDPLLDPNIYPNFNNNYQILLNPPKKSEFEIFDFNKRKYETVQKKEFFIFESNLYQIIAKQFILNGSPLTWTYSESIFFSSYANNGIRKNFFNNYITGLNIEVLLDPNGVFYIIHPNETIFKRSILTGNIINRKELITKYLKEVNLIELFFELLIDKLLVVNISQKYNLPNNPNSYLQENLIYKKTILGQKIQEINSTLMLEEGYENVVAMSIPFGCREEIIILISMLKASNFSINDWIATNIKNPKILEFEPFFNIYGNELSDYITLYNIYTSFIKSFGNFKLFKIQQKSMSYLLDPIKNKFERLRKYFNEIRKKPDYDVLNPPTDKIPLDIYETLTNLSLQGNLYEESAFDKFFFEDESLSETLLKEIKDDKQVLDWCNTNYINYYTLIKFINVYYETVKNVMTINRNNEYYQEGKFEWFEKNLRSFDIWKSDNINDNIVKAFLLSSPYKIAIKNLSYGALNNSYLPLSYSNFQNQKPYIISTTFKGSSDLLSGVKYPFSVIFFDSKKEYPKSSTIIMNIISNIKIEWLIQLYPHIYNPIRLVFKPYSSNYKILYPDPEFIARFIAKAKNSFDINVLDNFSNSEATPILNEYYKTIKNAIKRM